MMKMTVKEMILIRNYLRSRKAYEHTALPCGVSTLWEPYMADLLQKIEDELEVLS